MSSESERGPVSRLRYSSFITPSILVEINRLFGEFTASIFQVSSASMYVSKAGFVISGATCTWRLKSYFRLPPGSSRYGIGKIILYISSVLYIFLQ